jgi:hypothetical protein
MPNLDPIFYFNNLDQLDSGWQAFTLTGMAGATLFPTIQGSGDAQILYDFGPFIDPITGNPTIAPPVTPPGYATVFPGWLDNNGGTPALDTLKGSATIPISGQINFPTVEGMAQASGAGWKGGGWMFVITQHHATIFSVDAGGGVCRFNPGIGFWISAAAFGPLDDNGGAGSSTNGATLGYHPSVLQQGNTVAGPFDSWLQNTRIAIAVAMEPLFTPQELDLARLLPVQLPCAPCCPLCIDRG